MTPWPQQVIHASERGRIVCMDSLGYADERIDVCDVVIGASHGAPCATQLVIGCRPRGVICHDAGIGYKQGGIAGLGLLDLYRIPGAAVAAMSARISDAVDMYRNGVVSAVNASARAFGIDCGMRAMDAAHRMLEGRATPTALTPRQFVVSDTADGRVLALDTVKYVDARVDGSVLCLGSHAAKSLPRYIAAYGVSLAGIVANDVGRCKDDSGIAGLARFDDIVLPACAVSCVTARVGDARSTYFDGIVSVRNGTATALGIDIGDRAASAARRMLQAARRAP